MYYVYAIRSVSRNYTYIGITDSIKRRLFQHNSGSNKTTRPYGPFELILLEEFPNRIEARQREKQLKTRAGREMLKRIQVPIVFAN
jgi:putative endonuclease